MPFQLTKEQLMIQKNGPGSLPGKKLAPLAAERDQTHTYPGGQPSKKWETSGFWACWFRKKYGGEDMGTVGPIPWRLRKSPMPAHPLRSIMSVHNSICCSSIEKIRHGSAKRRIFSGPLAGGEFIGAFALTEPEAGSDPQSMTCTAVRDGGPLYHQRHQAVHHHRQKIPG